MAHLAPHAPDPVPEPPTEGRLDFWKEIAVYLRRDVRTVQRWEKSEGLPVRRHQHDTLGSVWAYRQELDAWLEGRQPALRAQEAANGRVRRRLHWAALGGLVVLASAGVFAARPLWNGPSTAPVVLRTTQLTTDRLPKHPHLATDGSHLYFTEQVGEGWVVTAVPTSGGEPTTVPIPLACPIVTDVSPDGSEMLVIDWSARVMVDSVFFHSPLYRVPSGGGTPRRVGRVMAGGARWLPDGRTILYGDGFQLKTVNRDGGAAPRTLVTMSGVTAGVSVSPDGEGVRFSAVDQRDSTWSLWEIGIGGGAPRRLWPEWSGDRMYFMGSWSPDGDYFLTAAHGQTPELWVVRGGTRWLGREAAPERVTVLPVPSYGLLPSRDGQRLFLMADFCSAELVQWDPWAREEFVTHPAGIAGSMVDYSPDGAWMVYVAFSPSRLWRARVDGTERRPLTDPPLEVGLPRWSPDGERIAFMARRPGGLWRIYAVPSDGGSPVPLLDGQSTESDPGWSPDGRSLVFGRLPAPNTRLSIHELDLATGQTTELPGSEGKYSPRWSPDGRLIAALSADSQRLLVFDLETGRWSERATGGMGFPTWSRDGSHLYYQDGDNVIHRLRLRDGRVERVVSRKGVPVAPVFPGAWFGFDPEGRLMVLRDTTVTEVFGFDYAYR